VRTLVIAQTELLRRLRSRSALVSAFFGPLALAVVIAMSTGGGGDATFEIGVADADASALSRQIVAGLRDASGPVRFERVAAEDAREQVRDGDLDAAIVIPRGYAAAQRSRDPQPLVVLRDRPIAGQVAEGVARSVAGGVERVRVSAATAAAAGLDPATVQDAARRAAAPVTQAVARPEGDDLSPPAYFGASMSVMFLYFTMALAGRALFAERDGGTLQRILATPTGPGTVVAGKTLAIAALAAMGFVLVWLVTTLAFGARWGPAAGVLVLIAASVVAVAGVSLLVASLGGSERRADALTSVVGLVFALVGGNFVPPAAMPPVLRDLSLATPNGWALRGFTELSTGVAEASEVAVAVAVLVAFGALFGTAGFLAARRVVRA
jgi:ABC-2 type transport system permease protein